MSSTLRYFIQRYISKRLNSPQRKFFDEILSLEFSTKGSKTLFIGVEWYNAWLLRDSHSACFTSIDPIRSHRRFGARHHIAGFFPEDFPVSQHIDTFDSVVMNGVYGWGVDTQVSLDNVLRATALILRSKGRLFFGYNTDPTHHPLGDESLVSLLHDAGFREISRTEISVEDRSNHAHIFLTFEKPS